MPKQFASSSLQTRLEYPNPPSWSKAQDVRGSEEAKAVGGRGPVQGFCQQTRDLQGKKECCLYKMEKDLREESKDRGMYVEDCKDS